MSGLPKLRLIAVGKSKEPSIDALVQAYRRRLGGTLELVEVESRRSAQDPGRRDDEALRLLEQVTPGSFVVALDEHGTELGSEAFAALLGRWRDQGVRELAFLIGGADGHGAAVRARAQYQLALGRMTWPHLLVRVLVAEQLYRAAAILAGHPYHRA